MRAGNSMTKLQEYFDEFFTDMNVLLKSLFNIYISMGDILVGDSIAGWNNSTNYCADPLGSVRDWHTQFYQNVENKCKGHGLENENCQNYDNHGLWALFHGCNEDGGMAYVSQICRLFSSFCVYFFPSGGPSGWETGVRCTPLNKKRGYNVLEASYLDETYGKDATWLGFVNGILHALGKDSLLNENPPIYSWPAADLHGLLLPSTLPRIS